MSFEIGPAKGPRTPSKGKSGLGVTLNPNPSTKDLVKRVEPLVNKFSPYQKAFVCRGVFDTPEWRKAAEAVMKLESSDAIYDENLFHSSVEALRDATIEILKKKRLDQILVNGETEARECKIDIKTPDPKNVAFRWHRDFPVADDSALNSSADYDDVRALRDQTLVAIVALKKIQGTEFYVKNDPRSKAEKFHVHLDESKHVDCRDPDDAEDQKPIFRTLNQGDLNIHAAHGTCHRAVERAPPWSAMIVNFRFPYECFDQVVTNLVAEERQVQQVTATTDVGL